MFAPPFDEEGDHVVVCSATTCFSTEKFLFEWTVSNFSLIMDINHNFTSPPFPVTVNNNNYLFTLKLCPYNRYKNSTYLTLTLSMESFVYELPVSFKFMLMDGARNEIISTGVHKKDFKFAGDKYGPVELVAHANLVRYLVNSDKLILLVDGMSVIQNEETTQIADPHALAEFLPEDFNKEVVEVEETVEEPQDSKVSTPLIIQQFRSLLLEENWSDVTLVVDEKEIKVHRYILAARSPVFKAMFLHDMDESRTNRVNITDITYDVLEEMVNYIYTDQVFKLDTLALDLIAAAEKYELNGLKDLCEQSLIKNLSLENVLDTLITIDLFSTQDFKNKVIDFIKNNSTVIVSTERWVSLLNNHSRLAAQVICTIIKT